MRFVSRTEELAFLHKYHEKSGFQFIPLYGRRRVGKTRLVREFIRDKRAIYFLADSVTEGEQLRNLGCEVGEFFGDTILVESGFRDWQQFFRYLKEKAEHERLVVVIDEFPYLVNSNKGISSIFQKGIDTHLKESNVFLILLGSSIGMMEEEVLFYKAPLYGRRTASLEVREMPFTALAEFFPETNLQQRLEIYGVFGSIPAYIERLDVSRNIQCAINDLVLDRGSFLYNEVEFLLREELREPRNYFVILRAIAQGKRKMSEIINNTGLEKSHLARYLDILRSLRFVDKEIPVTERYPDKSRLGLYRLHDRYFSFWFKYVFPHRSRLEIGNTDYLLGKIRETFDQHLSFVYEDVCRERCLELLKAGTMTFSTIGRWWLKNEEIDLVALDEEGGTIWFGECKWSINPVGEDIYRDLQRKTKLVLWGRETRQERFILFSKSGFTDAMRKLALQDEVLLVAGWELL
ncbi:MAG: ATP-binding protein [Desulfuromonadales bacterium]|nr:ATP-binding protein [Desulfuromonadales bacterium]